MAWSPDFMGFGNLLFLHFWAFQGRRDHQPRWVLQSPSMQRWLALFPRLRELTLTRGEVAFRDQRLLPWRADAKRVAHGGPFVRGFSDSEIRDFVGDFLLPSVPTLSAGKRTYADTAHLTLNIRRGDYYSVPSVRGEYGFDVDAYLKIAVPRALEVEGPVEAIHVISDGPGWCRARLGWLADHAPVVSYADPNDGPEDNFLDVARSRRLVITNSTFSYWAAYISNALYGDNHASVHLPAFFDRSQNEGRTWLHDERWSMVEDIPGGWDS